MIHNIQTLRVLFAMLVITGHLEVLFTHLGIVDPHYTIDGLANDGFLIVSAFVIIYSGMRKPAPPTQFAGRRFSRLIPFYWVITLAVAALDLMAPSLFQSTHVTPETLTKSLLFIPYVKHDDVVAPIVFVGWTMNYVIAFIALHALNMWLFGRRAWMATTAMLAALACYGLIAQPTNVIVKFFTGLRLISFALGALLAGLWSTYSARLVGRRDIPLAAIAIGVIVIGVSVRFGQQIWFPDFDRRLIGPFAACAIVIGALALEANGNVHRGAIRDRIAEASFSIYLSHFFVTQTAQKLVQHFDMHNVLAIVLIGLCAYVGAILLGVAVCQWLEKPLDKAVREGWRRLTQRPEVAREARAGE